MIPTLTVYYLLPVGLLIHKMEMNNDRDIMTIQWLYKRWQK